MFEDIEVRAGSEALKAKSPKMSFYYYESLRDVHKGPRTVSFHRFDGIEWVQQHEYTITTSNKVFVCDNYKTYMIDDSDTGIPDSKVRIVERGCKPIELGYVRSDRSRNYCRIVHIDDNPIFTDVYHTPNESRIVAHRINGALWLTGSGPLVLKTDMVSPNPLDLGHVCFGAYISKDSDITESNGVPMKAYAALDQATPLPPTTHMRSGVINGQIYSVCGVGCASIHMRDIRVENAICIHKDGLERNKMSHSRGFLASGAIIVSYWNSIELSDVRYLSSSYVLSSNPFYVGNTPSVWAET